MAIAVQESGQLSEELCLRCYLEKEKRKGLGIAQNNEEKNFPVKGKGPVKESSWERPGEIQKLKGQQLENEDQAGVAQVGHEDFVSHVNKIELYLTILEGKQMIEW